MKENIITAIMLVPLFAAAQPPGMSGGGFPGGGPPGGEDFDPEAMMDELMAGSYDAREKVDYAASLLYPASETFFTLVNETTALPALSGGWNDVNAALDDAFNDEEMETAEKNYSTYLEEFNNCRAALNDAWKDKNIRKMIINRLAESRDLLVSTRYDIESAVEISKDARDDLKEYSKKLNNIKSMASEMPSFPGGSPHEPDKEAVESLSAEIDAMDAAKEKAEAQMDVGKELLEKLDKIL
jgi:hypothetical protein